MADNKKPTVTWVYVYMRFIPSIAQAIFGAVFLLLLLNFSYYLLLLFRLF